MTDGHRAVAIPALRYDDAPKAIEWLCRAFGFEQHLLVPGPGATIAHAQLVYRGAMIMLGSQRDDALGAFQKPPSATSGVCTQSAYLVVRDADAHHARAVAAGARVVMPLEEQHYGGHAYSCLDCEGHLWNFGTYDPWAAE